MTKIICARCKRHARKLYRIVGDDPELVCRECVLKDNQAACGNCGKAMILYKVWDAVGLTDERLCRDCFLSEARAEPDEIDDYRMVLRERAEEEAKAKVEARKD